jgi:hypothetical protein
MPLLYINNMNKASKIVSDLVLGERFKTFVVGYKGYTMYSPTIKTIMRCTRELSHIDFTVEDINQLLKESEELYLRAIMALSYAVVGDVEDYETKAEQIAEELSSATPEELTTAMNLLLTMISGEEVFLFATCVKKFAQVAAKMTL